MARRTDGEEPAPWGRSVTSWLVVAGILAVVVVNETVDAVAAAGTLAGLTVLAGLVRLLVPRASGLSSRSRPLDAAIMLVLGAAIAVLAAVVPR